MSHGDVVVPVVAEGAHVAELAGDCLRLDDRVARDDARLPESLALRAGEACFVETFEVAVFTATRGQVLADRAVHVDLENPVADLVSLGRRNQVLFGQRDVVGRRNIGSLKVSVVRDSIVLGVFDSVVQVDVAVEEDKGSIVHAHSTTSHTSVMESFVCADVFAVAKQ